MHVDGGKNTSLQTGFCVSLQSNYIALAKFNYYWQLKKIDIYRTLAL